MNRCKGKLALSLRLSNQVVWQTFQACGPRLIESSRVTKPILQPLTNVELALDIISASTSSNVVKSIICWNSQNILFSQFHISSAII